MVNSKIDEFKLFVKANPFLISYIRDGKKSWQDFYEIYDMYGDDIFISIMNQYTPVRYFDYEELNDKVKVAIIRIVIVVIIVLLVIWMILLRWLKM